VIDEPTNLHQELDDVFEKLVVLNWKLLAQN
jgi:hypothetical protein